jgi:hypothetical protein
MYDFDEMPADVLARAMAYIDGAFAPLKVRSAQLEVRIVALDRENRELRERYAAEVRALQDEVDALQSATRDRQAQIAAMDQRLRDRGA